MKSVKSLIKCSEKIKDTNLTDEYLIDLDQDIVTKIFNITNEAKQDKIKYEKASSFNELNNTKLSKNSNTSNFKLKSEQKLELEKDYLNLKKLSSPSSEKYKNDDNDNKNNYISENYKSNLTNKNDDIIKNNDVILSTNLNEKNSRQNNKCRNKIQCCLIF